MNFGRFQNGIGTSKYDKAGFHTLVGCDIHSVPGSITSSKSMVDADSGGLVDALPTCSTTLPNGDSFFGNEDNGKIWKVTSGGAVSLVHTNTEGANFGMEYHDGYLYYWSATELGRIAEANASSESSWTSENDTWNTLTNTNTTTSKGCEQNLSLFVPNGNLIASVDGSQNFQANSLDLQSQHVINAIIPDSIYVLIGTQVGSSNNSAGNFVWDTYSGSWTVDDYIDEIGVNMYIPSDNTTFIQIGTVGNIYYWTGAKAELYTRLKDSTTFTTSLNPYGSANLNGLPLIATNRGIYSLGKGDARLPIAQVIEYVPSAGQGTTLGAMQAVGNDVFVGYKDGSNYGIDHLSTTKYDGKILTPMMVGRANSLKVMYDDIPTNCSITARTDKDGAGLASETLVQDDEEERVYRNTANLDHKSTVQAEITLDSDSTNSPTIHNIEIV